MQEKEIKRGLNPAFPPIFSRDVTDTVLSEHFSKTVHTAVGLEQCLRIIMLLVATVNN